MGTRMRTRAASAATALGLMMSSLTPVLGMEGERVVQRGRLLVRRFSCAFGCVGAAAGGP